MIDVAKEIRKFRPIDLNNIPGKYAPTSDKMYEAFVLYNKALHQLQLNGEDDAKNFLRKATLLFPEFYEANMVLGILVFASGDRIGAVRVFNSIGDNSKREDAIALFDHLVQESEKPEKARNTSKRSFADRHLGNIKSEARNTNGRATERDVLGENIPGRDSKQNAISEARYSKGQIFKQSSAAYEPQEEKEEWNKYVSRPSGRKNLYATKENRSETTYSASYRSRMSGYGENANVGASVDVGINANVDTRVKRQVTTTRNIEQRASEREKRFKQESAEARAGGEAYRSQIKDANDIKMLNKYLLIVIGILLLFSIIISTLLVNRIADVRKLEDKLDKYTSTSYNNSENVNT